MIRVTQSVLKTAAIAALAAAAAPRGPGDVVLPALRTFLGGQWPDNSMRVSASGVLRPSFYDIAIRLDPAIRTISGSAAIHAVVPSDSKGILLTLSRDLTVDSVYIDGSITTPRRAGDSLVVPISTGPNVADDRSVVVQVKYHGTPPANSLTFSDSNGHFSAATYGLPYRASGWWPSPGSTTMKADSADVRITVPSRYMAVSNGLLKGKSTDGDGWVTYHWSERYPIYPDVISIAVAEYASFSDSVRVEDGHMMPLTFFVFPADSVKARRDFGVFPALIRYYESVLGPYPFSREKYGVAEFARSSFREHQTIPSLGSTFITGDRKNDPILAHELAHQWFGNSLSVRNWKDVWLNEGLATYAAVMWLEHDQGRQAYDAEIDRLAKQRYEGPIRLEDSTNIARMFTSTTFEKAALMVHAIRLRMGDRRFRAALRIYTERNKYGLVSTDDFRAAMETECGESLDSFFRSWLDTNGFVPPFGPTVAKCKQFSAAESTDGDWPTYGRDAGGGRFSPLASITRENVHLLREAWRFSTGPNSIEATTNPAEGNTPNFEATPIVVDGRMYLSTPLGRVFALDPSNGAVLWSFDAKVDTRGNYGDNANRGVATWLDIEAAESGQCRRRIFLATIDARLIALDARDGQPCTDFGRRGVIDLTAGLRNPPEYLGEYEETSPPTVVNGVVVVGSGIADNNRLDAPSGVVRGFDVRTGRLLWSWEPVPQDSRDSAWVTWEPPQAHRVGAANAWSVMSSDPGNDLVFVPTGSASVDYYGGERLGSNLYANSIVALRASTGHKVWHFQLVHHDLWDYDVASPPLLTTLMRNGRQVPVVIQMGKTAQVFVLDRLTGAPIFPVDERPVPRSHVPGEKSSETQPFSAGLPSLVAARAWLDSAFGLSISDRNVCKTRMSQLRYEGPFTPPSLEGSMYSPSQIGGAQWGGLVYDPQRSIIVLPVNRLANAVQLIPRAKYDSTHDEPGWQYTAMTGTPYVLRRQILTGGHGLPCTQPPFSTLVAISLRTRRKVWEIPLGDTRLALRIAGDSTAVDSRWGTTVMGGPIATAGGIVFIAGTSDNLLRGIDIDTGAELWRGSLPGRGKATPMTYYSAVTKKQYVVVAAGGGNLRGKGATIVAFALP